MNPGDKITVQGEPSYRTAVTSGGATACAVASAAVFAEPPRVLPDTSKVPELAAALTGRRWAGRQVAVSSR